MPSGTQSNLCALLAHCGRGDEYLVGQHAHTYRYEGGGAAVLGGIQPQPLPNQADGSLLLSDLAAALKPDDPHCARSRLLCLENTWNGQVLPLPYIEQATAWARATGLATHLDGARLFNAAVASGDTVGRIAACFDSVSLCFSKGLGAPVGSMLCGSRALMRQALRARKMLGGGMRQSGVLAAAALHALDHHVDRLAEDHARAARLAKGLGRARAIEVRACHTNMVFIDVPLARLDALRRHLEAAGIRASIGYLPSVRLVTHLDIDDDAIERSIEVFARFDA
jgi:threonine aldolase